jgi:hypothetical protein
MLAAACRGRAVACGLLASAGWHGFVWLVASAVAT